MIVVNKEIMSYYLNTSFIKFSRKFKIKFEKIKCPLISHSVTVL